MHDILSQIELKHPSVRNLTVVSILVENRSFLTSRKSAFAVHTINTEIIWNSFKFLLGAKFTT